MKTYKHTRKPAPHLKVGSKVTIEWDCVECGTPQKITLGLNKKSELHCFHCQGAHAQARFAVWAMGRAKK